MKIQYAEAQYGKVVMKEKELPKPGPGQLLLEAEYSSISPGTEYNLMAGNVQTLPQNIGYSMIASVVDVGEGVSDYKVGDLVAATAQHASHLILDEKVVTPAPKGIDMEQAAFFILAHTAMYGIRRSKIQLGEPVVVLGQGMVGSLVAQLAKLAGACPVIVTDVDDNRLEHSKAMGVDYAINTKTHPDELKKVIDSLGMGGVPVVLEATGAREPLETAFEIVGEQGRVMMLSTIYSPEDGSPDLKFYEILINLTMKGATLIGGYVNSKPFSLKRYDLTMKVQWPPILVDEPSRFVSSNAWTSDEDIRVILNLIKYGSLNIKPLISHRFTPAQVPEAYEKVWKKDFDLLGGLICWK
jgi:NADPH2:quinone reductase